MVFILMAGLLCRRTAEEVLMFHERANPRLRGMGWIDMVKVRGERVDMRLVRER